MSHESPSNNNPDDFDHLIFTGLRAPNDGDRSPEYKDARQEFVEDVDDLLGGLQARRDAGETVTCATGQGRFDLAFTSEPRLTNTTIGHREGTGVALNREDRRPGLWLGGDGVTTRLHMQVFIPGDTPGTAHIIEAMGRDPIAQAVNGDDYTLAANTETVVSVMARELSANGSERYFGYKVKGDGSVHQAYVTPEGVHSGAALYDADRVQMAAQAFESEIAAKFDLPSA